MINLIDVRCDGLRPRGRTSGQICHYLLCRVQPDTSGVIETKCPRCNKMQMWTLPRALNLVGSTA